MSGVRHAVTLWCRGSDEKIERAARQLRPVWIEQELTINMADTNGSDWSRPWDIGDSEGS